MVYVDKKRIEIQKVILPRIPKFHSEFGYTESKLKYIFLKFICIHVLR